MEYVFPTISVLKYSGILIIVIGILMMLGVSFGRKNPLNYIFGSVFSIALGLFFLNTLSKGGTIKIDDDMIRLKIPIFREKVILKDRIESAEFIDLNRDVAYQLKKRKSGTSVENFNSGWFVLNNGEDAFVLLAGSKALLIRDRDGRNYMIGMKDMQKLRKVFEEKITPLRLYRSIDEINPK